MEDKQSNDTFLVFNIREFLFEVLHWKYVIILLISLSVLVLYIYTAFFCTPKYSTSAKILILNSSSGQVGSGEYSISTYLTRDFSVIITEREVLDEVIEQLDLKMTYEALQSCVVANNPVNTRIIEINVTTTNPHLSQEIANKICEVSREKIVELMGVDRVNIFSAASLPRKPSSPDMKTNLILGFGIGVALSAIFVILMYCHNDKINGSDDVQKYLGLCTLATIPYNQNKVVKKDTTKKAVSSNGV